MLPQAPAGLPARRVAEGLRLGRHLQPRSPHRYFGDNIYNASGARQTVQSGLEEANDIRFWLRMENDGGSDDTFYVKGCSGNTGFVLRAVLVGAFTQSTNAQNVTRPFKRGTAHLISRRTTPTASC